MKVMLPIVDNERGKEKVARGFHNARYICIYDSKTKMFDWLPTKSISSNPGDFSKQVQQMGINTVISSYLPPLALRIFARSGLDAFKARGSSVEENIRFFSNNQLETFTTQAARETWACTTSCSSCSSTSCN